MPLEQEFIFESAPFDQCHAATLAETPGGELLAAWFAGQREGAKDVGIWLSRRGKEGWTDPVEVVSEPETPCWNPVLFQGPDGVTWLFYKVGVNPRAWSGAYLKSGDAGRTWSPPVILPAGLLGPIKNKPIVLSNGEIMCPTSVESYRAWTGWVEVLNPDGTGWERFGPIRLPGLNQGLIQPSLIEPSPGKVRAFLRSTKLIGAICVAESEDFGRTWSPARKTDLPNPNSGIDAVLLDSGRTVMVYNHTTSARSPLNAAISDDQGETWGPPRVLEGEPGEYSYPAVIQTSDEGIHAAYTHQRSRIRHSTFNEDWLLG
jgi:predicted neuraminidase